jgi:hypothetical protein
MDFDIFMNILHAVHAACRMLHAGMEKEPAQFERAGINAHFSAGKSMLVLRP